MDSRDERVPVEDKLLVEKVVTEHEIMTSYEEMEKDYRECIAGKKMPTKLVYTSSSLKLFVTPDALIIETRGYALHYPTFMDALMNHPELVERVKECVSRRPEILAILVSENIVNHMYHNIDNPYEDLCSLFEDLLGYVIASKQYMKPPLDYVFGISDLSDMFGVKVEPCIVDDRPGVVVNGVCYAAP